MLEPVSDLATRLCRKESFTYILGYLKFICYEKFFFDGEIKVYGDSFWWVKGGVGGYVI